MTRSAVTFGAAGKPTQWARERYNVPRDAAWEKREDIGKVAALLQRTTTEESGGRTMRFGV